MEENLQFLWWPPEAPVVNVHIKMLNFTAEISTFTETVWVFVDHFLVYNWWLFLKRFFFNLIEASGLVCGSSG